MKIRLSKHSERAKAKYIIPFTYSLVGMGLFFYFYYYFKYQATTLAISCALASAPIDKAALTHYMEMIDRNTKRIHDITTSMRTFSDKDKNKKIGKIEIQALLNSLIDMNSKKISQNQIKVSTHFYNEPLLFNGIYTEIFQAFYNNLENSFDL